MKKNEKKVLQALSLVMQLGLNMIVPIFLCTMLGVWIGDRYGIPIVTVPLFLVGVLAGFTSIFKMVKKLYGRDSGPEKDHAEKTK